MKKSIIAAGASAVALAAMPMVGVFAYDPANTSGTLTDTLTVNIPAACTIANDNSTTGGSTSQQTNPTLTNEYYVTMANGEFRDGIGGAADSDPSASETADNNITVSCNTAKGDGTASDPASWVLTAVGAGATSGHTTDLWNSTASAAIPAAAVSAASTTSGWSYKVTMGTVESTEQAAYDTGYVPSGQQPTYKAITTTETDIAKGSGSYAAGFTMEYAVYVDDTQAQGTYEGAVKYTLYNPAG